MKTVLTSFCFAIFFFVLVSFLPSNISAQTCTGTTPRCGSKDVRRCTNASGQTCLPGSLGCTCVDSCEGTTWTCNSCSDAPANGGCAAQYACTGIGTCVCIISGSCRYSATPPPGGGGGGTGGCTEGACHTGIANCGAVGKDPGSGTCSGGLCCKDKSGGVPAEWCNVAIAPAARTLQRGATLAMTISLGGSGSYQSATFTSSSTTVATVAPGSQSGDPPYGTTVTARAAGTSTIRVTVRMADGNSCTASSTITVQAAATTPPAAPTVNLKVNNSDGPISIANNTAATLSWTTTNATSCEGRQTWTGAKAVSGSQSTGRLATGSYVYTLFCTGAGGSANDSVRVNVGAAATIAPTTPPAAPTVDLKANNSNGPISIAANAAATLSWTTTNATSCEGRQTWTGAKNVSGSQSTGSLAAGTYVYTLFCTGAGGSANDSVRVNVAGATTPPTTPPTATPRVTATPTPRPTAAPTARPTATPTTPPAAPTVDIRANNSNGPISITANTAATLSWTSSRATTCTASGGWSGSKAVSGSQSTGNLTVSRVYSITCTGAGGTVSDSVTVNVIGASAPPTRPTVDIRANSSNGPITITSGTSAVLSWTSTNSTSCTASGGWSGSKAVSGSQATGNLTASRTYSITCSGAGGTASDNVTVNIAGAPTTAPTSPPSVASCTIAANPASISGSVGTSRNVTTTVTSLNGTISQLRFISSNASVATAVSPDSTSPYSSQVSIVGSGTANIRVSGIMGGVERCSDTVPVTATVPTCTLSLGADRTVALGTTANVTASTTGSGIQEVRFESSDTGVATVTPAADGSTPYVTRINSVLNGQSTITARGIISGVERCRDSIVVTVPAPSCTITLSPDPLQGIMGQPSTMAAATTQTGGVISEVRFVSANSSVATLTSPDASAPYTTTVTGVGEGRTTVTAEGVMYGVARCQDTATLNIIPPEPWFQLTGGDGISGDNLDSPIPPTCVLPGCDPHFILDEVYADPGIALYNGSIADFSSSSSSQGSVSSKNWLAQTRTFLTYSYDLFVSLIPGNAPRQSVPGTVPAGYLDGTRPTDPKGYTWYVAGGAVTLNGNTTLTGNRKVILFVPGNVTINGQLNLSGANNFLLIIARGDIIINPDVTNGNNPALEGIFYSQATFRSGSRGTGNQDARLVISGSVVATDILFERDLRSGNASTPAETVEYSNNLIFNYPSALAPKRLIWRETLP